MCMLSKLKKSTTRVLRINGGIYKPVHEKSSLSYLNCVFIDTLAG